MASSDQLTPYAELAYVIRSLPLLVHEKRRRDGLSLRAAAQQSGMSFSTLSRIESGEDCALSNAMTLLMWLDEPTAKGSKP